MRKHIKKIITSILFIISIIIYQCPIRLITGIECPGCGLTNAVLCALRLDFKSAFSSHPLFLIPMVTVIYLLLRNKLSLPKAVEITIGILFIMSFVLFYVIKIKTLYCQ